MDFSKEELKESIIYLAVQCDQGGAFRMYLSENVPLPKVVGDLIHKLFLFPALQHDLSAKHHIVKIYEYWEELTDFGYVKLKQYM